MPKTVSILGSTGSVGQSTVKVIEKHQGDYDVKVLTAFNNWKLLVKQALSLRPETVVIVDEAAYPPLLDALSGTDIKVEKGEASLLGAALTPVDWTMAAITGMAGLKPLLNAIQNGGEVAIANKEPLVAAGELIIQAAEKSGAVLLPVDSEHNAIFQVFEKDNRPAIERLIVTGSGGPFRTWHYDDIKKATPEQALKHPNWSMGQKITIDSATLMNKALEVIEAHILFGIEADKIEVLIHPQSIVHSMVEYKDGSVLSQMGAPDMCTPIANALAWPKRIETPGAKLDIMELIELKFEPVDHGRFPAISLAYQALKEGAHARIALNAANEVAVESFLSGQIAFTDIVKLAEDMMGKTTKTPLNSLEDILDLDDKVREQTKSAIVEIEKKRAA